MPEKDQEDTLAAGTARRPWEAGLERADLDFLSALGTSTRLLGGKRGPKELESPDLSDTTKTRLALNKPLLNEANARGYLSDTLVEELEYRGSTENPSRREQAEALSTESAELGQVRYGA